VKVIAATTKMKTTNMKKGLLPFVKKHISLAGQISKSNRTFAQLDTAPAMK